MPAQDLNVAKFLPLQSCIDVSFWSELADRKLHHYKLSDEPVPLQGWFAPSRYAQLPGQFLLDANSFSVSPAHGNRSTSTYTDGKPGHHQSSGQLLNFNTMEAFQKLSPQLLLQQAATQLCQAITSGAAEQDPSLLCGFRLVTYADLKKFQFAYWFLLPALKPPAAFQCQSFSPMHQVFGQETSAQIAVVCDQWRGITAAADAGTNTRPSAPSFAWLLTIPDTARETQQGSTAAHPLSRWQELQGGATRVILAISDTSNMEGAAGWALRNVLLLAAVRWRVNELQVLCVRDLHGKTDIGRSMVVNYVLPAIPTDWCATSVPQAVGWEPNAEGRLAPRHLDLSALMSPVALAEQAVGLNLQLMKWRAVPELDTKQIADTKCMLLGAGTLGCAVARTLLAWGVRHITFIDSSKVAFSNPVRQSLFTFEDCLEGGKPKAQAAADALLRIFPSAVAAGIDMTIPMPGHPPSSPAQESAMQAAALQLDSLVQQHDAVFLLTDTRESRWLPSLLAATQNKIAITSAVGFDGFLVMRHGPAPDAALPQQACHRLGCYFCNDVVAPLNSTRDRTLDQQCTVARPGLAPIAGAVAVELLAALLQHPLQSAAPPPQQPSYSSSSNNNPNVGSSPEGVLGPVPHMVRGQLSGFQQTCMQGQAFSQCTACSMTVVKAYREGGWEFLKKAIQDPGYLEELTGLSALHQQTLEAFGDDDSTDEADVFHVSASGLGGGSGQEAVTSEQQGDTAAPIAEDQPAKDQNKDEIDEWTAL